MLKLPEILEQLKVKARKCLSTLFMSLSSIFFINKFWYLPDKRISAKTLLSVSQKNLEGNLVIKYIKNKISKGIGNNVFTFVYGKNNLIFSRNSFFVQKANRALEADGQICRKGYEIYCRYKLTTKWMCGFNGGLLPWRFSMAVCIWKYGTRVD